MRVLNRRELQDLAADGHKPVVSIYQPGVRSGPEMSQNPIRFRNLVRRAEQELSQGGFERSKIQEILGPAQEMLNDRTFWEHPSDGLAVFLSPGRSKAAWVPVKLDEAVMVGSRLHLKPLLPLLSNDGSFYVLSLSQDQVRLYENTRWGTAEVELGGIPRTLEEALGSDWEEESLQFQTTAPSPGSVRGAVTFYGHGGGSEDSKKEIARYLKIVDNGIMKVLNPENGPVVLAGVKNTIALYRTLSRHPRIVEEAIEGAAHLPSPDTLREKAWPLVAPLFEAAQKDAAERLRASLGTGLATAELVPAVKAAREGRVHTLFLAKDATWWGRVDAATGEVHPDVPPGAEADDLLDVAASECILHGGQAFAVPQDAMPAGGPIAALLRY